MEAAGYAIGADGRSRTGVVLGTYSAGGQATSEYLDALFKGGPTGAPALLFNSTVGNAAAGLAGLEYKLCGPNATISQKESSGLAAIATAVDLLRARPRGRVAAGGMDAIYDLFYRAHDRFAVMTDAREPDESVAPFARTRGGFVLGEGAYVLWLQRAAPSGPHAAILGTGAASDTCGVNAWPDDPDTLARAMSLALEDAGLTPADVDVIYASANAAPKLDYIEARALGELFGIAPGRDVDQGRDRRIERHGRCRVRRRHPVRRARQGPADCRTARSRRCGVGAEPRAHRRRRAGQYRARQQRRQRRRRIQRRAPDAARLAGPGPRDEAPRLRVISFPPPPVDVPDFQDLSLHGRVAVVTGGSRGIGRGIAERLADRGAAVAVAYREQEVPAREFADAVSARGGRAWAGPCDVADEGQVTRFFEAATAALGPVDILVNNAGITRDAHALFTDTARWNEVLQVNLQGAFYCVRAVTSGMLLRGWGRIINISSPSARMPLGGQTSYAAVESRPRRVHARALARSRRARACSSTRCRPA